MAIKSYRDLEVWQESMALAEEVYRIIALFPKDEKFALGDQLRRAVVSVPSNIAEGFGRGSSRDYLHFLSIARGSLFEVCTQLELSARLNYHAPGSGIYEKATRISKMLTSLMAKVRESSPRSKTSQSTTQAPMTNDQRPTTNDQ